jgi:TorA maturation chaperone TorD
MSKSARYVVALADLSSLLSQLLIVPTPETVEGIRSAALTGDIVGILSDLGVADTGNGVAVLDLATGIKVPDFHRLRQEYTRIFTHPTAPVVQIYESLFCYDPSTGCTPRPRAYINAQAMSVERYAGKAGVPLIDSMGGANLPADHMAVELFLLAALLEQKRLTEDDAHAGREVDDRMRCFVEEHLRVWAERFFARVIEGTTDPVYLLLGMLGQVLIQELSVLTQETGDDAGTT